MNGLMLAYASLRKAASMKSFLGFFSSNPGLTKFLAVIAAGVVFYFSGGKMTFDDSLKMVTGLLVGWHLLPRAGDVKKASVLLLAFLLVSSSSACGLVKNIKWPEVVKCTEQALDVVPQVTRILLQDGISSLSDSSKNSLIALAEQYGADVVSCAVQEVVADLQGTKAALDPVLAQAVKRGSVFLASQGVKEVHLP